MPLLSLAIQLPHWAARIYLGWHIDSPAARMVAVPLRPLSISDILIGTAVVGVTLSAAQFINMDAGDGVTRVDWSGLAFLACALFGLSLVFLLPLLVIVLRMTATHAIAYILLAPLVGLFVFMAIMVGVSGGCGSPDMDELPLMYVGLASCLAICSLPLWLARLAGYRLVTKRGR